MGEQGGELGRKERDGDVPEKRETKRARLAHPLGGAFAHSRGNESWSRLTRQRGGENHRARAPAHSLALEEPGALVFMCAKNKRETSEVPKGDIYN